jgi:hypothetical protein
MEWVVLGFLYRPTENIVDGAAHSRAHGIKEWNPGATVYRHPGGHFRGAADLSRMEPRQDARFPASVGPVLYIA